MFALLRRHRQQPVAVAGDQNRHIGQVFAHVLGHVLQVFDAWRALGVGQFGGLELIPHITRAQPQLESAVGQVAQRLTSRANNAGL